MGRKVHADTAQKYSSAFVASISERYRTTPSACECPGHFSPWPLVEESIQNHSAKQLTNRTKVLTIEESTTNLALVT